MSRVLHPSTVEREALLLFEELTELEPGSAAWRDLVATASPEVRTLVSALDRAHRRPTARLDTQFPGAAADAPPPPAQVGSFRLVEPIGSGGMGEVWRAERADGLFDQAVAIKFVRRGLFGALSAERFAEERRLLARMRHPNVAQLIDGGVTESGLHWLATELVAGAAIDRACASRTPAANARIFLQAAHAVQYAHGKLVAHGDVKPANILVDEHGHAKLLDFGVARLIEGDGAHLAGAYTAGFASPERLNGGAPSVADDVFALGRTLAAIIGDAKDRELAAIIARATAPETARYPNVQALIADVERWLEHRPVTAMNGRLGYRLRKFVGRHVVGVAATAVAVVTLACTTLVAEHNATRAQEARRIEAQRFADAHRTAHYLMFDLLDRLQRSPGTLRLRAQVGTVAQHYLDRLAAAPNAPVAVRLDVARGYLREAETVGMGNAPNMADVDRAHRDLDRAIRMLRGLRDERPQPRGLWVPFSRSVALDCQNQLYGTRHDAAGALRTAERGLRELATVTPDAPSRLAAAWPVRICAGDALVWLDRTPEAIPLLEASLATGRRADPADLSMIERNQRILGEAYFYAKRYPDAERVLLAAAAIQRAAHRRDPFFGPAVIEAANVADDLASTYAEQRRFADELRVSQDALTLVEAQAALDPDDQQSVRRALSLMRLVADALASLGKVDRAIALMQRADARWDALRAKDPDDSATARLSLLALQVTGDLQRKAGDHALACATYVRTGAGWDAFAHTWRLSPSDRQEAVAQVRQELGRCNGGRVTAAR